MLNVGSGGMQSDGFVGVDMNAAAAPDVVADVRVLPFADCSFERVVAADVLEHVLPWQVEATLAEWRRVLERGGRLTVRVPNLERLGEELCTGVDLGSGGVEHTIANIYGGHRWGPDGAWDVHHVGFTEALLDETIRDAGFLVDSNDGGLNMTVEARRVD